MAHRAMPSKCDPSTNPWVFCTEWGPYCQYYWGTLPLKIRVSKDLEGTLNLSRTLPGTAVSTGSQVMSNCDRGLSCVRITCRVQCSRPVLCQARQRRRRRHRQELKQTYSKQDTPNLPCQSKLAPTSLANFAWLSSASLAQGFRGKVESFPPSLVILCLLRCTLIILKFPKTSAGRVSLALSRTKARTQSLPMSGSFRRIAKVASG